MSIFDRVTRQLSDAIADTLTPRMLSYYKGDSPEDIAKHISASIVAALCDLILTEERMLLMDFEEFEFVERVVYSVIGKPRCVREEERILNSYIH